MSKLFWDNYVDLGKVERRIKKIVKDPDERVEMFALVDEIIHHRALGCILDNLPEKDHKDFLSEFAKRPHDEGLFVFLRERVEVDFKQFIKHEMHLLLDELLLITHDKWTKTTAE